MKYLEIQQKLLKGIRSGLYKVGDRLPPEREIARLEGVSHMTARHAIRKLIEAGVLASEHGRGTFVISTGGRPEGASKTIAVISPGTANATPTVAHGVLQGIHDVAQRYDYHLRVYYYSTPLSLGDTLRRCCREPVHGLAIWYQDHETNRLALEDLKAQGIRFVLLDSYIPGRKQFADAVVSRNAEGGAQAIEQLYKLGHRRIAYLTSDEISSSVTDRNAGVAQAMKKLDLHYGGTHTIPVKQRKADLLNTLQKLIHNHAPTALMVYNDQLAIKLLAPLKKLGLRVPDDVSVAGFDDIDHARHINPPLTTVAQDFYGMGKTAANLIIKGPRSPQGSRIRELNVTLRVRGSISKPRRSETVHT